MTRGGNPTWYKDAIVYELHVKAFRDSNGDGRGDFRGLIEKLDYLESLGVTAVWLLPFYPSPQRDDGYDISDYRGIHPDYGTLRDFRQFVREAHRRGLRVITELVVNHTSDQHPWFQAARRAKPGSARRNYYVWNDDDAKYPETRIIFSDTETSNWTWDPVAGQYYWHRFFSHQPDLNLNNPKVVQAVIKVLRFWLKMGVDGLRLDAVPYLCVREGTNNENLPETHAVIKQMRAAVDAEFADRMLLAEANQWPEDVRPYFGDGDACHMAYHFPLMPRIFMALSQEDRRPITEILGQTPDIPETCQWGLFLRNHDELTLEMVTDEERDYMYSSYAADRRMRLNLGIRRRLAPLVNNSMRRIELLNSLLFSFPGTPFIYYGDEIGMGDNIFLGDRDGVRTPMQWSMDRNAGFSSADPAQLYLPVLMDPVYGFGAVNVEAQERNRSSLLHFMRRLISLRRQHKAFGRGTMEFLYPENRHVLAYVRRYMGETLLCLANLSRYAQPVELDLREFDGWTPVEMIGRTEFPTIGELPYFLTVGPHAFYWFRLEPQPEPIAAGAAAARERREQLPVVALEAGERLFDDVGRHALEQEVLPDFLRRQRWFRSKARELVSVRLLDWCRLGAGFHVTFVEIRFGDGETERYVLPLKSVSGRPATAMVEDMPDSIIAHWRTPRTEGVICDALADRTSANSLYAAMIDGRQYDTARGGRIRAFAAGRGGAPPSRLHGTRVRQLTLEQSNTSIVLDDAHVLKFFRQLEAGINPDLEVGLHLTERTDFTGMPRVHGGMEYEGSGGERTTLAMLQDFVANEGDGWQVGVAATRRVLDAVAGRDWPEAPRVASPGMIAPTVGSPPEPILEAADGFLQRVGDLGRRTAEFHLALTQDRRHADFAPRSLRAAYLESLSDACASRAHEVLELLNGRMGTLDDADRDLADRVLAAGPNLIARFQDLPTLGDGGQLIRIHGDYHLGQVLATDAGWLLIDFEGEPLRSLAERRERQSPLKDVAGMLRSFDYAAQTVRRALTDLTPERGDRIAAWSIAWTRWCSSAFLGGYLETMGDRPPLPASDESRATLLESFVLDKAFYELSYELNNRPDWIGVPLAGILDVAARASDPNGGEERSES
ncbi:maltose alpha-D-glucosyltransferase [bacterium]|nr:maltose alpha-D-glucosyltransferase [bacterium]